MMRAFIQILPSKPLKPGDSWESGIDIEELQGSEISLKNTLKHYEQDTVIIDAVYKRSLDDKPIKDKSNPKMIFTEIDYRGTAQIGKSSGWITHKEVKTSFSAELRYQGITTSTSVNIVKIIEPVGGIKGVRHLFLPASRGIKGVRATRIQHPAPSFAIRNTIYAIRIQHLLHHSMLSVRC